MRRQAGCASVWDGRRRGLKMIHAGLAVGSAEESRGAAHSIAGTEEEVEAAPSSGRDERLVGAADNRAASRPVTYLRIVVAARAICLHGGAAQLYGGIGLSARCCAARGSADAKDASGWENAGRVAWSTCGHGGRGSERGGGVAIVVDVVLAGPATTTSTTSTTTTTLAC